MEQMDHDQAQDDAPVKSEPQPDETDGDITMADVNPMPASEQEKKEIKLEDLFADVDSDEEFPSTERTIQSETSPGPGSSAEQVYEIVQLPMGARNADCMFTARAEPQPRPMQAILK